MCGSGSRSRTRRPARRTGSITARTTWSGPSSTPAARCAAAGWSGTCGPDGSFDAAYCLISATGELISGECHSVPEFDAQGNIRITDHFRRSDGTTGTSHIRQIPAPVREA